MLKFYLKYYFRDLFRYLTYNKKNKKNGIKENQMSGKIFKIWKTELRDFLRKF